MQRLIVFFLCCVCGVLQTSGAGAAQAARYAIAYGWDGQWQRAVDYRARIAPLLGLQPDTQLEIVGRGQEFGVVWNTNGSQAQATATANQHSQKLKRAGLKPARPITAASFFKLFHLSYGRGAAPEDVRDKLTALKSILGARVGAQLVIEQSDDRSYAVVYRCWQGRAAAIRLAKQHAQVLKKKKIVPTLVAAVPRPAIQVRAGDDSRREERVTKKPSPTKLATAGKVAGKESTPPGEGAGINSKMGAFISEQTKKGRLRPTDRVAWAAYDLTSNSYLVSYNATRPFQAASMIKPFVALAFFHQHAKGVLPYTAQHRQMMEAMIQHSSNPATNWFIRLLGGPARCQALLKKEYGHLFRQVSIREYIPPDGRTYKNSALPSDYIQFLRAMWQYQLPNAKEMLRVMSLPGPDRLVYGSDVPGGTRIYNKTGTTAQLCGDMGILVAHSRDGRKVPYAVVGLVERSSRAGDYKQWMHNSGDVIREFSSLVYGAIQQKHNLL
jgi:beta-lactamase class A